MKVTIAGANSFIGKRMIAYADKQKDLDLALVIRRGGKINLFGLNKQMPVFECDMADYDKLGSIVGGGDCFIDLSWMGSRGTDRQDSELQSYNYKCNMNAMRSMANAGYSVLVSAGSQAEYGQCSGVILEDTPLNANTEYGKYKVSIYQETTELCKGLGIRFIEPRYFSLYGPGDYEKTLVMSCIEKMLRDIPCELNECTQLWDYLYIDDAVEAVFQLCRNENSIGAYNIATGAHRQLKEYVMDIHETIGNKSPVHFGGIKYDGLYIDLQPIVEKLKRDANWYPKTSFKEGIRRIVTSLKQ